MSLPRQPLPAPCRRSANGDALVLCLLFLLVLAAGSTPAGAVTVREVREVRQAPAAPEAPRSPAAVAGRDSLLQEIRHYREVIRVLSDSLALDKSGARLSAEHRVVIEQNIGDITRVIEGIGTELRKLEFEVKDNRISLVDGAGDGIIIAIPENLDERVSQGLEALTQAILKELPDSAGTGPGHRLDWSSFIPVPEPPEPPRRVINGNLVRVGQSLVVAADEDVRGNVVVVFGNCDVAGRVEGNVVTVGGGLSLRDEAEVSGSVVAVGGRLAADAGAETGDTVALDWLDGGVNAGLTRLLSHRVLSFVVTQGLFFLTLLVALVAVAASPGARLAAVLARLRAEPMRVFGAGAVLVLVAPLALAILTALLVITVIGVPVALLLALGVAAVVVLSLSATGVVVGERVGARGRPAPLAVALGLIVLHVPSFLGSLLNLLGGPWTGVVSLLVIGLLIKAAALAFGLGALVLTRLGTRGASA
ncbi:MAG: polymer-forming cytoskeletal protein [bacterium]|nr:polymer-forming cytoskeletal protein [bacterium]